MFQMIIWQYFICISLLIPLIVAQYAVEDDTRCGNFGEWWIYHKSKPSGDENCYQFLNNQPPANWETAETECKQDFKADFLLGNEKDAQDLMVFLSGKLNHWARTTYANSEVLNEVWTGIKRISSNGKNQWKWKETILKEADLPLSEEAKNDKTSTEKCVMLRSTNNQFDPKLYLRNCGNQLKNYICMKKAHAPRPRTTEEDK